MKAGVAFGDSSQMARFLLLFDGAVIKEIPAKNELTVGRKANNDIVIESPAVSGYHCKIFREGDTFFVEDLHSTNGVFLNTKKIVKSGLQNNDVIGIGKHFLKFIDEAPSPSVEPRAEKPAPPPVQRQEAIVRIVKGIVTHREYELKNRSTYIGKSDHVQIKIRGTGLFGSAPESAAMIAHQRDGYFLIPVKQGYVKLNGRALNQRELLKDGDVIQAGGTTMKFEVQNPGVT
jgi:pSer/pThr/pTyr-binding forkhead associated (FHA) protein